MDKTKKFDIAVIGGGLAGLSLAIQMAKAGRKIILFEKESFPFHKVCGEYISMESWNFLISLGMDLPNLNLPKINTLIVTATNGKFIKTRLPLGGFGISRYKLDSMLAEKAKEAGVLLLESTKVTDVVFQDDFFTIKCNGLQEGIGATICCGAFGKRTNLDVKWKRSFLLSKKRKLQNYIGVKYHLATQGLVDTIALHNFKDGYCGISKIEGDRWCLCYMTTAENLKACNNSIAHLEEAVLSKNPALKKILKESEVMLDFPITISQINFNKKAVVENNILMLGDAAGTITPLCGNGMSMALHSSKMLASLLERFFAGHITRQSLEAAYSKDWHLAFGERLWWGRRLQMFFGSTTLTNYFVAICKLFPYIVMPIIRKTHGKPF